MPPKTQKQARFFGAVAGGKARKKTSLSRSQARESLRGTKVKSLPKSAKSGRRKRRKR